MTEPLNGERPKPGQIDLRGFEWYYLWSQSRQHSYFEARGGDIYAISQSPNGAECASACGHDIAISEVATGRLLRRLQGHTGAVKSMNFSRDGKYLVSAAEPAQVIVWELATDHKIERSWPGTFSCLAVAPDATYVALAETNASHSKAALKIWTVRAGVEHRFDNFNPHVEFVTALCFTPDNRRLYFADKVNPGIPRPAAIHVLDLELLLHSGVLPETHSSAISAIATSEDGKHMASVDNIGAIAFLDPSVGLRTDFTILHRHSIPNLSFSPDGKFLAVGLYSLDSMEPVADSNTTLSIWSTSQPVQALRKFPLGLSVRSLNYTGDGKGLVVGGADRILRHLSVDPVPERLDFAGHKPKEAWAVAYSPVDRTLASAGDDDTIKFWDATIRRHTGTLIGHTALVSCVAFSPDGVWLVSGSYDRTVRIWNVLSGRMRVISDRLKDAVRSVVFSPDGKLIAAGAQSKDPVITVWEAATGKVWARLDAKGQTIRALVFTSDSRTLISGGDGDEITLWDLRTNQICKSLKVTQHVHALAISPNGITLAAGQKGGTIARWNLETGEEENTFLGHRNEVRSVVFSPDGKTLVSGGADRAVRLWNADTNTELLTFAGLSHNVNSVTFSRDGQTLAAAIHDGSVIVWHAPRQ